MHRSKRDPKEDPKHDIFRTKDNQRLKPHVVDVLRHISQAYTDRIRNPLMDGCMNGCSFWVLK